MGSSAVFSVLDLLLCPSEPLKQSLLTAGGRRYAWQVAIRADAADAASADPREMGGGSRRPPLQTPTGALDPVFWWFPLEYDAMRSQKNQDRPSRLFSGVECAQVVLEGVLIVCPEEAISGAAGR